MADSSWDTRTKQPRGWEITYVDLRFFDALVRHGTLTYGQLERYFYSSPRTISYRLGHFTRAGLVTIDRTAQTILGRVIQPTTRLLRFMDSPLPMPKPVGESGASFAHEIIATELLLELESTYNPTVTSREILHYEKGDADERAWFASERGFHHYWTDANGSRRYFAPQLPRHKGDAPERVRLRFPDGAYTFTDGTTVALEVERTPKSRERTAEILAAYTPTRKWKSPFHHAHWLITPAVERMLVGNGDGLLFQRRPGSTARCADPTDPRTWTTFDGKRDLTPTVGVHVLEPLVAVDDGAGFSLARFTSRVATRDLSRAQWIAQRTDRPTTTSPLLAALQPGTVPHRPTPPQPEPESWAPTSEPEPDPWATPEPDPWATPEPDPWALTPPEPRRPSAGPRAYGRPKSPQGPPRQAPEPPPF